MDDHILTESEIKIEEEEINEIEEDERYISLKLTLNGQLSYFS